MASWRKISLLGCVLAAAAACSKREPSTVSEVETPGPPRWHFARISHDFGPATLTGVYVRGDGTVFAVGWYGSLYMSRPLVPPVDDDDRRVFERIEVPTFEHLTAIAGVANGARFGLPDYDGEIFAVGWHGTLLHYHPNPDLDPLTEGGQWELIAGPGAGLRERLRVDPACPDYDGDGISDDGNSDGFWTAAETCRGGVTANCDDNCRGTANGPQRPLVDTTLPDPDGCLDGPDPTRQQVDVDSDGVGLVCDDADDAPGLTESFEATLFDVAVEANGAQLTVIAVGEDGALVTFVGVSAADPVVPPALVVTDPAAWTAQTGMPFRYEDDCIGAAPGTICTGSGRLPPSCPAQCSPVKTQCQCPLNMGQCCDAGAPTGAGCSDGSCGSAPNACDADGNCSTFCPDCFRRQAETLRSVAIEGSTVVAVGSKGVLVTGDITALLDTWQTPTCTTLPPPLDSKPLLTAVAAGGGFQFVGAGGTLARFPAGACEYATVTGAPPAFLSGLYSLGGGSSYIVGDRGTLAQVQGDTVTVLETDVEETLFDIGRTFDTLNREELWIVGATGLILQAVYY